MDLKELDLVSVIGFDGVTKNGLHLHPDNEHLIYPLGIKIVMKSLITGHQTFLSGHTNTISALSVSQCGEFIASGQVTHLGFKAKVIIWNYKDKTIKCSYEIHKVRVNDVCFSSCGNYLISLGGRDDGNIVIYDIRHEDPICGSAASHEISGDAYRVASTNTCARCFVSIGNCTFRVWTIDRANRRIRSVDVKVGKLRRTINCVTIDKNDEFAYCGTTSGDLIVAKLNLPKNDETFVDITEPQVMIGCYSKVPKDKKKFQRGEGDLYAGGIQKVLLTKEGKIVVGAGDGTVELIEIADVTVNKSKFTKNPNTPKLIAHLTTNVCSSVTSMFIHRDEIFVGTSRCEIYRIKLSNFDLRLLVTCHTSAICSVVFPRNYSEIFATGGKDTIRLWLLESQQELLRISVPNFVCSDLCFSNDGRMIISAWNDGVIRACTPQTGTLIFAIHNAHLKAVSAITIANDDKKLITGGYDGQVRIWEITPDVQKLVHIFKGHKGPVTFLDLSKYGESVVSSSTDGSCIIWDLTRLTRKQTLFANTMFMSTRFHLNCVQLLTCGTDRKIGYWEILDGSVIREIDGSDSGVLNCIDISPDGKRFVVGSNDFTVKLYDYETADITHVGRHHAGIVTACKFSPDGKHLVTVSAEGSVVIYRCPLDQRNITSVKSASSSGSKDKQRLSRRVTPKQENVMSARSDTANSVKVLFKGWPLTLVFMYSFYFMNAYKYYKHLRIVSS